MGIVIRQAAFSDAQAIAHLHHQTWQATYRDLAPKPILLSMTEAIRLKRWQELLSADMSGRIILVVEVEGKLAGFGVAGPPSHEIFADRAEIKFLYVGSAFKRMGIGRRLLIELGRGLSALGYTRMALGVVVGNDPAIAFYDAMGGKIVGRYTDSGPVWRSDNFIVAWDEMRALAA